MINVLACWVPFETIYPLWNSVENSSIEGVWILTALAHQLATLLKSTPSLYDVQAQVLPQGCRNFMCLLAIQCKIHTLPVEDKMFLNVPQGVYAF